MNWLKLFGSLMAKQDQGNVQGNQGLSSLQYGAPAKNSGAIDHANPYGSANPAPANDGVMTMPTTEIAGTPGGDTSAPRTWGTPGQAGQPDEFDYDPDAHIYRYGGQ